MLKIWGRTNSVNVKKALWCAEELGLSYERIDAGGPFGIVNEPAYRALNPNGLIPTLEDNGLVLWESNVIVRYLAAKHGAVHLYPAGAAERARLEMWMDWVASSIMEPYRQLFWNTVRLAPEQRDHAAAEKGLQELSRLLVMADHALSGQPYLSGESFGVADIPLGCIAYSWLNMPIQRPELPHFQAWYERLAERPAYQKIVIIPLT